MRGQIYILEANSFMSSIKILDDIVQKNSSDLDIIKNITPLNLNEENEKFLQAVHNNIAYNPQYCYTPNFHLKKIEEAINQLDFGNETIDTIYRNYKRYLLNCIKMVSYVGDPETFTKMSIEIFGYPSEELKEKAIDIFAHNNAIIEDDTVYDAVYLKDVFDREINKYHFKWDVKIVDNISSKVAVDPDKKTIFINNNVLFSENDVKRLLVHEFGTHVMRAENGSKQKYLIFQNGFPKSIETEEGLATYNEWKNNLLDIKTLKVYAGRVLAVDLCLKNSFYESFMQLKNHFSEEECVRMISRVKRGLTDTSQKGAFTKDFVYLNGFYRVKDRINAENEKVLYSGIVGLDDLDNIALLEDIIY